MNYVIVAVLMIMGTCVTRAQDWEPLVLDTVLTVSMPPAPEKMSLGAGKVMWGAKTGLGKVAVMRMSDPKVAEYAPLLSEDGLKFLLRGALKAMSLKPNTVLVDSAFTQNNGLLQLQATITMDMDGGRYETFQSWSIVNGTIYILMVLEDVLMPGSMEVERKRFFESVKFNTSLSKR